MPYLQHYNLETSMGDIIRTILKRKGLTQSEFAEKMGFKKANASNLINRKDWPISKILQASEVLEEQLLTYYLKKSDYENSMMNENNIIKEDVAKYESELQQCKEQISFFKEHIELLKNRIKQLE